MLLRPCQREARAAVLRCLPGGRNGLVRMPTRSGKLLAAVAVLHDLQRRGLLPADVAFVTSRTLLVDDAEAALWRILDHARWPKADQFSAAELNADRGLGTKAVKRARASSSVVGRVDGHKVRHGQVMVTTYASLDRLRPCALVVCDEAHRTKGKRIRALLERHGQRVGFTATPHGAHDRDRLPFDELWYELRYEAAKEQGVVIPWRPVRPVGALPEPGDDGLLDPRRALPVAVQLLRDRGGPAAIGPVLFTAPNLTVAAWIAEQLRAEGWTAVAAVPRKKGGEGYTRKGMRVVLAEFEAGEVQCLVTVDWLAEGVTIPALRAVVLTSQPRGRVHLCQLCGRAMGTCAPDRWGTKTEALIFDPCGVLRSHKLEHDAAMGEAIVGRPKSAKRAARDGVAALTALPYAAILTPLEDWSAALWQAADALPRPPGYEAPRPMGTAERRLPATAADLRGLRARLGLARYISGPKGWEAVGEAHRTALRTLAEASVLPRGVVLDLIAVLDRVARVRASMAGAAPWRLAQVGIVRVPVGCEVPA